MRSTLPLIGLLAAAMLLPACQGWEAYSEPTVIDEDGMGHITFYEASGGWRNPPEGDGKGVSKTGFGNAEQPLLSD